MARSSPKGGREGREGKKSRKASVKDETAQADLGSSGGTRRQGGSETKARVDRRIRRGIQRSRRGEGRRGRGAPYYLERGKSLPPKSSIPNGSRGKGGVEEGVRGVLGARMDKAFHIGIGHGGVSGAKEG